MNRILICAAAVLFSVAAFAEGKGSVYLSGSISLSGGNTNTSTVTSGQVTSTPKPATFNLGIAPQVGYFVTDNIDINLALKYDFTKSYIGSSADNKLFRKENIFMIEPGINYYVKISDRLYYVPGLSLGVGFGRNTEDLTADTSRKSGVTELELSLKLLTFEFRAADHFGIMLSAGDFSYDFNKNSNTTASGNSSTTTNTMENTVGLGLNLGTSIGLRYYF